MLYLTTLRTSLLALSQILLATTTAAATSTPRDLTSSGVINYPYDYSSLTCPSPSSLELSALITPTYGTSGGVFTVCSCIQINAPASLVRDAILDFKSYPLWNSFVVFVSLPSNVTATPQDNYVGMPMTFTTSGLVAGSNTTSNEVLTVLDGAGVGGDGEPYFLAAWRYDDGLAGIGSRAEHPCVIVDLGNDSSWLLSYESYYAGLLTPTIALLKSQLQEQFDAQAADLKTYVEGLV
ncbi:hypothetical protein HD806DRAFT_502166 [Xylariaceae sp. AK1471]|nr:hypothetical protein HD806DRAFT_502166 [Xylariaceae sp. AK1471]